MGITFPLQLFYHIQVYVYIVFFISSNSILKSSWIKNIYIVYFEQQDKYLIIKNHIVTWIENQLLIWIIIKYWHYNKCWLNGSIVLLHNTNLFSLVKVLHKKWLFCNFIEKFMLKVYDDTSDISLKWMLHTREISSLMANCNIDVGLTLDIYTCYLLDDRTKVDQNWR